MKANQLRLSLASVAYVLLQAVREQLVGTELERATCGTLRVRLLKLGAQVRVSVRRVLVSLASSFALQDVFSVAYERIRALPMRC
jgi:hypothetical protein